MAFIKMGTSLPGPRSAALLAHRQQVVPNAFNPLVPAVIDHAEGALVTDVDGNVLIDLGGGIGCLAVGHSHPQVVQAIQAAAARFTHTDFSIQPYEVLIELADQLVMRAPGSFAKKAAFFNAGVEAVENAVKIARKYTGRPAIIAMEGGFHGRTLLGMSLTGSAVSPYKAGFGPFAPEIYRVPFPYLYRWEGATSPEQVAEQALNAVRRAFRTTVHPASVAAIIVEPVQGEGGFIVPPADYLRGLQALCREHGILLIADEIQTGWGRTGRFFASEQFGIEPDLICIGKSLAAGLPLSGVIGRSEVMDAPRDGELGGTYVGNPVACVAALAVLAAIDNEKLVDRALQLGQTLKSRFESLQSRCALIGDVRGLGAMVGVELVRDRRSKEPADKEMAAVINRSISRGVIALRCGTYKNVLRFLMPLVITDEQLHEALDVLEFTMNEVAGNSHR